MARPPLRATFANLNPTQQETLRRWHDQLDQEQCGLWVVGDRRSGSSYIAEVAVRNVKREFWSWEMVRANALVEEIHLFWSLSTAVRQHPDDFALWEDMNKVDMTLDHLWHQCELVWIDDLRPDAVDIDFWRRHAQAKIEDRVKEGKPTVIATNLLPAAPELMGLQRVIEDLFVVCDAAR